jgi:hypothetical protein
MVQLVELSFALCRLVKNGNESSNSRISGLSRLRLRGTDVEDPNRHLHRLSKREPINFSFSPSENREEWGTA